MQTKEFHDYNTLTPMVANKSGKSSQSGLGNEIIDCIFGQLVINKFSFNQLNKAKTIPPNSVPRKMTLIKRSRVHLQLEWSYSCMSSLSLFV